MYCFNMRECPPGCCIPSYLRYALSLWSSSTHQQHCLVVTQRLASIYKKPRHRNPLRLFRSRLVKLQGKLSVQSASVHQCRGVPVMYDRRGYTGRRLFSDTSGIWTRGRAYPRLRLSCRCWYRIAMYSSSVKVDSASSFTFSQLSVPITFL